MKDKKDKAEMASLDTIQPDLSKDTTSVEEPLTEISEIAEIESVDAELVETSESNQSPVTEGQVAEDWKEPEAATFTVEDIFKSQGCHCQRCGKDLSIDVSQVNIKLVDEYAPHSADNTMLLCNECTEKYDRERIEHIKRFRGSQHFKTAATEILAGLEDMGFVADEDNFYNTPNRFARAYQEIFDGCENLDAKVADILSTTFPANGQDTMVVAKDVTVFSMCPHHLLPVEYHVCVGYIPNKNGRVLGISKLTRLVELLAKRPVLQETFTQEIVDCLSDIGVYGSIALVEGQHMCMRMRGAKAINSTITTTAVSGIFSDDRSSKSEFLSVISDRMKFKA